MRPKTIYLVILLSFLWLIMLAGCAPSRISMEEKSARGLIINLVSKSITETESLTIRTEDGKELTLKAEGFLGFTPSHLREHQAIGERVTVYYREAPEGLIVTKVTD